MKTRLSGLFAVIVTAAFAASIAGCGGGGGGGGTTPTPVTITCPNGTTATDASLCPAAKVVLVTDSVKGPVSPDSFTGVVVVTDSTLDPSSLTTANVTLKAGGVNAVAGTVSATDAKGFKFVPAAKLNYGQAYTFAATVKDTLGRTVSVTSSITTTNVTCAAPQVWTPGVNACAYPTATAGTQIFGNFSTGSKAAAGCKDWHDQCWKDAATNGTVGWVLESQRMSLVANDPSNRPVAWAYFFNGSVPSTTNGNYSIKLFFADTGEPVSGAPGTGNIDQGYILETDWVMEDPKDGGLIQHVKPTGLCYRYSWYPATTQTGVNSNIWANELAACPK